MLSDSGEFYPFGAAMGTDEKVRAVGAHNGTEHPDPRELYRLLATTFSAEAADGRVAAAAIASTSRSRPNTHATAAMALGYSSRPKVLHDLYTFLIELRRRAS